MRITRSTRTIEDMVSPPKKEQQYALDGTPIRRNCVLEAWKQMKPSNFVNTYANPGGSNRKPAP